MSDRSEDGSVGFGDFADFLGKCIERAWEVVPSEGEFDAKSLASEFRTWMRAFMMGPAGVPLMFSPRSRELLQRMLYVYGFVDDPKNADEAKAITKEFMLAWLELADQAREQRDALIKVNWRFMEMFQEAMGKATAGFTERKQ
jgi:hypothetical protein